MVQYNNVVKNQVEHITTNIKSSNLKLDTLSSMKAIIFFCIFYLALGLLESPTGLPSEIPTVVPITPSQSPTSTPTVKRSKLPSVPPTRTPSALPTFFPSRMPSETPSATPSVKPSNFPTTYYTPVPCGMCQSEGTGKSCTFSSNGVADRILLEVSVLFYIVNIITDYYLIIFSTLYTI